MNNIQEITSLNTEIKILPLIDIQAIADYRLLLKRSGIL